MLFTDLKINNYVKTSYGEGSILDIQDKKVTIKFSYGIGYFFANDIIMCYKDARWEYILPVMDITPTQGRTVF